MLGSEGGRQRKRRGPAGPCWALNSGRWRLVGSAVSCPFLPGASVRCIQHSPWPVGGVLSWRVGQGLGIWEAGREGFRSRRSLHTDGGCSCSCLGDSGSSSSRRHSLRSEAAPPPQIRPASPGEPGSCHPAAQQASACPGPPASLAWLYQDLLSTVMVPAPAAGSRPPCALSPWSECRKSKLTWPRGQLHAGGRFRKFQNSNLADFQLFMLKV